MGFSTFGTFSSLQDLIFSEHPPDSIAKVEVEVDDIRIASATNRATVHWRDATRPPTKVFIKSCLEGSMGASLDKELHTFNKEATFYSDLLPKMVAFQKDRGIKSEDRLEKLIPNFIAAGWIGASFFICLEDFVSQGFKITEIKDFHSLDQIKLALTNLGRLHATSHAMKIDHQNQTCLKDYFLQQSDPVSNIFKNFFSQPLEDNLQLISLVLKAKAKNLSTVEQLTIPEGVSESLVQKLIHCCPSLHRTFDLVRQEGRRQPCSVLSHGDFHMWNMAFRAEGELKLFDFQIINWGSPACDIHHYLCQVTTAETRDEFLLLFLDTYLESFKTFYRKLGSQPPEYFNMETLRKEYMARSPTSFVYAFPWLMMRFVTDKDSFEKSLRQVEWPLEERMEHLDKAGPEIWKVVQVYLDNINHYNKIGTFDVIRGLL